MVLTALDRLLTLADKAFLAFANLALALMLLGGVINIVVREVFGRGLVFVFPATLILFAWCVFFGFFCAYRRGADLTVDFVVLRLPTGLQRIARIAVAVVTIALAGTILSQAQLVIQLQSGMLEIIELPRYWIALPLLASCALILMSAAGDVLRAVLDLPDGRAATSLVQSGDQP